MFEITTTRNNPMIDPHLEIWEWQIPMYLFIGGLVAGMMIIAGYMIFSGRNKENDCICKRLPFYGMILLSLGMFALFLDLEHKPYFWRLYTTLQISSPMSWGAWILLLVYPALVLAQIVKLSDFLKEKLPFLVKFETMVNEHPAAVKNIGVMNMIFGAMLGMYTGVLLSSLQARPLWNSPLLWMLFLISGLSGAAALVHMLSQNVEERELLAKADNAFLTVELFTILMIIIGALSSSAIYQNSIQLLLSGDYAPVFWVFVVLIGIVIPLVMQLLAVNHKVRHSSLVPVLVILGGIILRFVIVSAGQHSGWSALIN